MPAQIISLWQQFGSSPGRHFSYLTSKLNRAGSPTAAVPIIRVKTISWVRLWVSLCIFLMLSILLGHLVYHLHDSHTVLNLREVIIKAITSKIRDTIVIATRLSIRNITLLAPRKLNKAPIHRPQVAAPNNEAKKPERVPTPLNAIPPANSKVCSCFFFSWYKYTCIITKRELKIDIAVNN